MYDLDNVLAAPNLPTLPKVAVRVLELLRDPDVDVNEIGNVVQNDPAISGRILKTVNSSYYSLAAPCQTIHRALAYLGVNTVKSLVLGFSLVEVSKNCRSGFDLVDYWRRCLFSAAAARRIAQTTKSCDPDEAFIAALMQDIGMLAIHTAIGDQYQKLVAATRGDHANLPKVENQTLGFSHAEAGGRLASRWRLPATFVEPIRYHHLSAGESPPVNPMVGTVMLGYQISSLVTAEDRLTAFRLVEQTATRIFGLTLDQKRAIIAGTIDDAQELSSLLEVEVGDRPDVSSILSQADDALIRHQFDVSREADQLRASTVSLERETLTDALTGVGNRKRFDEELSRRFEQVQSWRGCLGLILIDIDDFKKLNDTFGHMAGDDVLKTLASRLRETIDDTGIVCRYGGEEFVAIMPGATRIETAHIAEKLRHAVESAPIVIDSTISDSVMVTASFGVAAIEPTYGQLIKKPEWLIQMADKSLYAAKRAGRNCVRVFTPRSVA